MQLTWIGIAESSHIPHLLCIHLQQLITRLVIQVGHIVDACDFLLDASLGDRSGEMRDLLEMRVRVPDSLHNHLGHVHSLERVDVTFRRHDIHTSRQKLHNTFENQYLIRCQVGCELDARKVSLEQDIGLEVWRAEVNRRKLDRHTVVDLSQDDIFVVPYWNVFEFDSRGHDFEQSFELGLFGQRHAEGVQSDLQAALDQVRDAKSNTHA